MVKKDREKDIIEKIDKVNEKMAEIKKEPIIKEKTSKPTTKKTVKKETPKKTITKSEVRETPKQDEVKDTLIEEPKTVKKKVINFSLFEVIVLLIIIALISGLLGFVVNDKLNTSTEIRYTEASKEIQMFIEEYNYVLENYYGEVDKNDLIVNAIKGMLSSLDDYSEFLDESTSNNFLITLKGSYEGLGVQIVLNSDGEIYIVSIFEDSPAVDAGLKVGDKIISLNGESLEGKTTTDFVTTVQESTKKQFTLGIVRDGEQLEVKINKKAIEIQSVYSEMLNNKIGYMGVSIFAENTDEQFKLALKQLEKDGLNGLIIDLRDNTGGHLETVEEMLYLFLDKSHIIYQTESNTETTKIYSKGKETKSYPIVILINGNSASASEIMAAALSEQLGAYIIGETSYGKGTVQKMQDMGDLGSYKFTNKKWLTPNGVWIDGVGIKPDLEIKLSDDYKLNPTLENDNQYQAAIDYLMNKDA